MELYELIAIFHVFMIASDWSDLADLSFSREMASAAITDQVACSLCNDFYTDARTLQCQHSFCLECVRSRYLSDSRQCPNCSRETIPNSIDEVESLVPSINLNQQVGLLIRQGLVMTSSKLECQL